MFVQKSKSEYDRFSPTDPDFDQLNHSSPNYTLILTSELITTSPSNSIINAIYMCHCS